MIHNILDMLFFKGFRAIESNSPTKYTVSSLLVNDTRKLNKKLNKILSINNSSNLSLEEINISIIKAFDVSEGEVETRIKTSAVSYSGQINYLDISGVICMVSVDADLSLLQEDLLCAFYKSRGGSYGLRRDFLNFINKNISETPYSRFIEI